MHSMSLVIVGAVVGLMAVLVVGQIRFRLRSKEAHRVIGEGALLLDVRTPVEFDGGHLPGERVADLVPMSRTVVVYCASGIRSTMAAATLRRAGFARVINLGPMSAL